LTHVYRILKPEGNLVARFNEVNKEKFEKFLKTLRVIGFANKAPISGHIANEVIFYKEV